MTNLPATMVVEEGRHSNTGASSSDIWLNCSGSLNLQEKLLKEGRIAKFQSRPAAEGTAAHQVLSDCLTMGIDAADMAGTKIQVALWTFEVDPEMVKGVQETIDWVTNRISRAKADGFEVDLYIEEGLSSLTDEGAFGTADIIIHIHGDRLIIVDFKYGQGVKVDPTSSQNAYYGYLAVENYLTEKTGVKVVESWIAQPRIPTEEGTIRRHVTSAEDLTEWWFNTIVPGIEKTRDPKALLTIGEHCRYCQARAHCPALKNEVFELPVGIDAAHMKDSELGEVLDRLKAIKGLEELFKAEALRRARQGSRVPGYKLVNAKTNRVFKDEMAFPDPKDADKTVTVQFDDAVIDNFGMDAYAEPKIKTPPQLEKLKGGKTFIAAWAYHPPAGLTIAPASDKRKEVVPVIERLRGPVVSE